MWEIETIVQYPGVNGLSPLSTGLSGALLPELLQLYRRRKFSISTTMQTLDTNLNIRHLTGQNCVICQDPIRGRQIRAPCGHYYDIACVTDLFQSATRDESLFPPRCCRQPIPFMNVRQHLTPDFIVQFAEKEKEFTTLKRVYCAKPSCSRFIGPQSHSIFGSVMTCPAPGCLTRTCRSCKSKVASGDRHSKCKVDEIDQQILALGEDAGWARCPGCAQMIELQMGCYHMTCRCKTEFCYLCTTRWKTCACTQWDERRLVAAAEERVDLQYRRPHGPRVIAQAGPRQPAQGVQPRAVAAPRQEPVIPTQNFRGDVAVRDEPNLWRVPRAVVTPRTHTATLAPPVRRLQPTPGNSQSVEDTELLRGMSILSTPPLRTHPSVPAVRPPNTVLSRGASILSTPPLQTHTTVPAIRPPNPVTNFNTSVRDRLVREAVEDLRVNHDCQHTKWSFRSGGGRCHTCYSQLPLYLFVSQLHLPLSIPMELKHDIY